MSAPNSNNPSRTSTPNPRFTSSAKTAEDLLANQTVGLVALSDFRKRRAEAIEQKDRAAQDALSGSGGRSGAGTPKEGGDGGVSGTATPAGQPAKKRKKKVGALKLSFGDEDDDAGDTDVSVRSKGSTPKEAGSEHEGTPSKFKKMGVNASVGIAPKALTKAALMREAQTRETLRKEFLVLQEGVKEMVIEIPFVFYDGTNIPGGSCRVKKGDYVWLFLDRSRKVGAELGVGEKGESRARKEWARIGVDDLMMVRGGVIIPHHYDFYYFIMNKTLGPKNTRLFDYSSQSPPTSTLASPAPVDLSNYNPLARPTAKSKTPEPVDIEGRDDDPTFTKVVDRRWYEKNKHIFPASVWQDFDPDKDYQNEVKRDAGGNAFFFS